MRKHLVRLGAGALATAAAFAMAAPADAAGGVKVGVLSCHEKGGWGFIFGSSRHIACVFSTDKGVEVHYTGHISKFGVDIGYQKAGVLVWTVLAPSTDMAPGTLAGDYGGATGGASVGVGGGANVLIGGSQKSISLQPVNFEGAEGVNVAGGIAELSLNRAS